MPAMHAKRKNEFTAAELIDQLRSLQIAGPDLKTLIELTNALIDDEFGRRVRILKQSQDGKDLPIQFLQEQLHRGQCKCVSAMRWLENEIGDFRWHTATLLTLK
jgi:hypothetical protein